MYKLWEHYFKVFRTLITSGWQVYKEGGSKVDYYVYPHTSLPTKFRMEVANEINTIAGRFSRRVGVTRNINYACSLFYTTEDCLKGRWAH